ncbi:MAG: hypothetical protein QNJ94_07945 [Alphaproteobacteria bacterium]|nr:hypothetical protein [Alphaproteobacteria bacterium]
MLNGPAFYDVPPNDARVQRRKTAAPATSLHVTVVEGDSIRIFRAFDVMDWPIAGETVTRSVHRAEPN